MILYPLFCYKDKIMENRIMVLVLPIGIKKTEMNKHLDCSL